MSSRATNSATNPQPIPRLACTPEEAGQMLGGLSRVTIYRLISRNRLRTISGIRHKLIPVSEIERFIREGVAAN